MYYRNNLQSVKQSSSNRQINRALRVSLCKHIHIQHQLEEIVVRVKLPMTNPPDLPRHVSLLRSCKEAMAVVADGMAVLPMLGAASIFGGFYDLLHRFFTLQ